MDVPPRGGAAGHAGEAGVSAGETGASEGGTSGANDGEDGGNGNAPDDPLGNIYNLVDAAAAAELEDVIVQGVAKPHTYSDPGRMILGVNGFLEQYLEDYDFIFLLPDHAIESNTYGLFEPINSDLLIGTGDALRWRQPGYKTNGRLKGVAGFQYVKGGFGPFAHELLHNWANRLDQSFGFGVGLDFNSPAHWGYADIHGQLGGYDPTTFRCETPAGASPPACDAASPGRYRYVASPFGPNANGVSIPYAPFELYLMGLLPRSEAPAQIHVLENAKVVSAGTTYTLEADGIKTVTLDEIVARHGEVSLLPTQQRAFKLAMVVVSATPAPADVLAEVAHWNSVFGNRASDATLPSFEQLTGGRATLDTRLGRRRSASDPAPTEEPLPNCDLVEQDCEPEGAACYDNGQETLCGIPGPGGAGDPCDSGSSCQRGFDCRFDKTGTSTYCSPYCNPTDSSSPSYCPNLCADYIVLSVRGVLAGACNLK